MKKKYAIGVDIGGSHVSCAAVDIENRSIISNSYYEGPIDNKASAEQIISQWAYAIKFSIASIDSTDLAGIGFAMPGPFDYENGIALFERVAKYESLHSVNVSEKIANALNLEKDTFVRFINDATSFALGESWAGKGSEFKRVLCITLGTGFGSAFIDKGVPVVERNDVPVQGCVWHLPYKDGIADDYFSTRWFIQQYKAKTGVTTHGVKEIASLAKTDEYAKELFVIFGKGLGEFLGPWLKKFNAEALIIGGNLARAYNLFGEPFENSLKSQKANTRIFLSELKDVAAIMGSAKLLLGSFWNEVKPLLGKM